MTYATSGTPERVASTRPAPAAGRLRPDGAHRLDKRPGSSLIAATPHREDVPLRRPEWPGQLRAVRLSAIRPSSSLNGMAAMLRTRGTARNVARTAGFNVPATVAAGLAGVVLARVFGSTVRGEYAAVTSWFGIVLMVGAMGQPAALCFFVARDPGRTRQYVATSRAMMLCTGAVAMAGGMLLAPVLARGNPEVVVGYRIAFGASVVAFVAASYTFSLQARDIHRWNVVRVSQPVLSLAAVMVLWRLRLLTLDSTMVILAGSMLLQLFWAYRACQQYYGLPSTAYTSSAITPVGDLYRHGEWVPVIAGMFLLGCLVRLLDESLDVRVNPHAMFLVLLFFPTLVKSEDDWISMVAGIPATTLFWLVAVSLSFRRRST